jgi:hypothetical protein
MKDTYCAHTVNAIIVTVPVPIVPSPHHINNCCGKTPVKSQKPEFCIWIHWILIRIQSVAESGSDRSGSRPRFFTTLKISLDKRSSYLSSLTPTKEKPPTQHRTLQTWNFFILILSWGTVLTCMEPDPIQIRIKNIFKNFFLNLGYRRMGNVGTLPAHNSGLVGTLCRAGYETSLRLYCSGYPGQKRAGTFSRRYFFMVNHVYKSVWCALFSLLFLCLISPYFLRVGIFLLTSTIQNILRVLWIYFWWKS